MKTLFKPLLVSVVLATAGAAAIAQGAGGTPQPGSAPHHHHMDPAKRQEMVAKRHAELKAKLQLAPVQDAAWASYIAAMQPPNGWSRPDRAHRAAMRVEWEKLTTPQRIERMATMRAKRDAAVTRRADATKTFYAALNPDQQKVFDANTLRRGHGGRHGAHSKPPQQG